jgi:hypothetical protein
MDWGYIDETRCTLGAAYPGAATAGRFGMSYGVEPASGLEDLGASGEECILAGIDDRRQFTTLEGDRWARVGSVSWRRRGLMSR